MPPVDRQTIESEIRDYPVTLILLRQRRAEAMSSSGGDHLGLRPSGISDPTYATVKRLSSPEIARMETCCRSVGRAYRALSPQLRQVVDLFYWGGNPRYAVAEYLGVSESTVDRMRDLICGAVAFHVSWDETPAKPAISKARRRVFSTDWRDYAYEPFSRAEKAFKTRHPEEGKKKKPPASRPGVSAR